MMFGCLLLAQIPALGSNNELRAKRAEQNFFAYFFTLILLNICATSKGNAMPRGARSKLDNTITDELLG
jgi:uncharacterized MAPEG superfamily protein